jgi:hypothetical protein
MCLIVTIYVKLLSSVHKHTHFVKQSFFHAHSNHYGGDNKINNFNKVLYSQLIVNPSYVNTQSESVLWTALFPFIFLYHLRYSLIGLSPRRRPNIRGRLHCVAFWSCSLHIFVQTVHNKQEINLKYCKRRTYGLEAGLY